ncbi:MAG: Lrp/AsnC family transcriptional regulator [Acidimicrobiales bacterium]
MLDDTDKAIIRELQEDGRIPYAQLAPRVGLSQAATRQRVNRLTEGGVIQIVAVTDPRMLGLGCQAMLGITVSGDVRQVADVIAAVSSAEYVVITAGRYDLLVEAVCGDADTLLELVNHTIRPIPGVASVEIMSYLRLVKQAYDWGTG